MKPRRQTFLLSKDENGAHFISEINTFRLPQAAGFSSDQCVVQDNKVVALADQFNAKNNSMITSVKNLVTFENNNWNFKRLR